MKKFAAMMMVMVILTMSLMAQAEGPVVKAWRVDKVDGKTCYYVTYETETGISREFQVLESEFNIAVELYAMHKNEETKNYELREYQENRGSWVKDVAAWCSFWNPND